MAREKGRYEGRNPSSGGKPKAAGRAGRRGKAHGPRRTGGDQSAINPKGKRNKR